MIYRKEARILCPQYDRISMYVFLISGYHVSELSDYPGQLKFLLQIHL